MTRRTGLPGAAELFRSTGHAAAAEGPPGQAGREVTAVSPAVALASPPAGSDGAALAAAFEDLPATRPARRKARPAADRRPTGRERHDEKITVYVSAEELLDLEHARLALRGDHGLPVDRGRVVREALAVVLADFDAKGEASILVRRLRGR